MSLPVAILAGGMATRLGPIAETIPKSVVDVAGAPFIARQLAHLREQGVTRVVLCVGHLGERIEAVVGRGDAFGIDVRYSWDGPKLLGTAGALRRACPLLGAHFFVQYGDSYLPIDFHAVERSFFAGNSPALMTVLRNSDRWDRSNVVFRDGRVAEYDKRHPTPGMAYIDYGLGVLSASVLTRIPTGARADLADLYRELSAEGSLAGHEVFERFYEIGSPEGLEETRAHFSRRDDG